MVEKQEGKKKIPLCQIVFLVVAVFLLIVLLILSFNSTIKENIPIWILIIGSIIQLIVFTNSFIYLIGINIDMNSKKRIVLAFIINIMFSISMTIFIFNVEDLNKIPVQLFELLVLILIIIFVCIGRKIEKGNDLSPLKATNYFLIAVYTGIIFFIENICSNGDIKQFVTFYYLIPMLAVQGLYELLDGKSKQN